MLRVAPTDAAIRTVLREAIQRKPVEHGFRDPYPPCRPMVSIGG